jgi:predicted nucleotidyltransferase
MALDVEAVILIVKKYVDDVRNFFPVEKVLLYGSYAKGNATDQSDVDVCFFLTTFGGKRRVEIISKLLMPTYKYEEIDIEPFAFEISELYDDNPFVKEVLRTGIEIQ